MTTLGEKIRGIAYFGLALGFGYSGYEILFGGDGPEGLHGPSLGDGKGISGQLRQTNKDVGHIDERVKFLRKLLKKASTQGPIHEIATEILSQKANGRWLVPEKDCWAEVVFIFNALRNPGSKYAMRYTRDSVGADIFSDADRTLLKTHGGDCFVKGTKVLRREGHSLVPIESLKVGDEIWGYKNWSKITKTWDKGVLPTWRVKLNNGSSMRLTPGHHVQIAECHRHNPDRASSPCCCPVAERTLRRVEVRDLKPNMVVLQPDQVAYGAGAMDSGRAYIEGLFLSDGWASASHKNGEPSNFCISGKDGRPKEAQKKEVVAICNRLGIKTHWHERYVTVKDKAWAIQLATMGHHAPQKHALSIDFTEQAAVELLRGIMADSGENTYGGGRTFTTTSRELWLQTRVLLKMAGVTSSERYIVEHRGLGKHPIWRLQTCLKPADRPAGMHAAKLLRVRSIEQDNVELPCCDIETSDHYVWLPEADWTTLNCDDSSIVIGGLLMSVGHQVKVRVIQTEGEESWNHVYLITPADWDAKEWKAIDASMDKPPGWEANGAAESARTGKPAGMVIRVKDYEIG